MNFVSLESQCFPLDFVLENCVPVRNLINNREFKKLRRQLQRKSHIKIELCVNLSLLRLFQVDHVVQNRRTALTIAWYEWFSWKAKSERFTTASSRCRQNIKYVNFTLSFSRLRQNIAPKSVPHAQHDYFSSFNQSNLNLMALSLTLPSSNLKLPNSELKQTRRRRQRERQRAIDNHMLGAIIPKDKELVYNLRKRRCHLPQIKTERYKKSFVNGHIFKYKLV